MLLDTVEKVLDRNPTEKYTIEEIATILILEGYEVQDKKKLKAQIIHKIKNNKSRVNFSFKEEKEGLLVYARKKTNHKGIEKISSKCKKINIKLTAIILMILLIITGYVYLIGV